MKIKIYIILFVVFFSTVCFAQDFPRYSGRVSVVINADDNIKGEIESYIKRELRGLGDIVVTNDKPDWILNINGLEIISKAGHKTGIVIFATILKSYDNKYLLKMVDAKYKELISKDTSDLSRFYGQLIRIGAPSDLRSICDGTVAEFDSGYIQSEREKWQIMMEALKNAMQNKKTKPKN